MRAERCSGRVSAIPRGHAGAHHAQRGILFRLDQPLSVEELLQRLEIDPRRVAVEHNLLILKRHAFAATLVGDGDRVEIVNFVGGR